MSTSLAPLALYVAEDCGADQVWRVRFWSAVAIAVLFLQFGGVALAAIVGSFVGMAIFEMASRGARDVRKSTDENSARCSRDRAESVAVVDHKKASAKRDFMCFMRKSFCAVVTMFATMGIAHLALSHRLLPYPVLSRA